MNDEDSLTFDAIIKTPVQAERFQASGQLLCWSDLYEQKMLQKQTSLQRLSFAQKC